MLEARKPLVVSPCILLVKKKMAGQTDLNNKAYVVAKLWKSDIAIHIRQFDKDRGKRFISEKGVFLTIQLVGTC